MMPPIPKPPGSQPWPEPKPTRLPMRKSMTLVVGFKCKDGFVVGSDTEIQYGWVNFQRPKVFDYSGDRTRYDLVIGGAGHTSFIEMAAQNIRDAVKALPDPSVESIKAEISKVILEIYDRMRFWDAADPNRPSISLIIGIKDKDGRREVFATDRTAVIEVDRWWCVGSGSELAAHLTEKLHVDGLSTAVTEHLVQQIFREVKGKGLAVGGNTQIVSVRAAQGLTGTAENFFQLDFSDDRFLWGMDDALFGAIRDALDCKKPLRALDERINFIAERLRSIRASSEKERPPSGDMQLTFYRIWHRIWESAQRPLIPFPPSITGDRPRATSEPDSRSPRDARRCLQTASIPTLIAQAASGKGTPNRIHRRKANLTRRWPHRLGQSRGHGKGQDRHRSAQARPAARRASQPAAQNPLAAPPPAQGDS